MKLRNTEALRAFVGKGEGRVLTGAELARKLDVSRGYIDHLLSGRRTTCTPEVAHAIESILQVPEGVIFLRVTHHATKMAA